MTDVLTFDAETHTYRIGGQIVPSVTQVLSALNDFSRISPEVLENARALGTAVHRAIELDCAGDLDDASLHPDVAERVEAWRKFRFGCGFRPAGNEVRVYSGRYGYAGTLDLFGSMGRDQIVIDIKATAALPETAGMQTAAYAQALRETAGCGPVRRGVLHLAAGGRWSFIPLCRQLDLTDFLALLRKHGDQNAN